MTCEHTTLDAVLSILMIFVFLCIGGCAAWDLTSRVHDAIHSYRVAKAKKKVDAILHAEKKV